MCLVNVVPSGSKAEAAKWEQTVCGSWDSVHSLPGCGHGGLTWGVAEYVGSE